MKCYCCHADPVGEPGESGTDIKGGTIARRIYEIDAMFMGKSTHEHWTLVELTRNEVKRRRAAANGMSCVYDRVDLNRWRDVPFEELVDEPVEVILVAQTGLILSFSWRQFWGYIRERGANILKLNNNGGNLC